MFRLRYAALIATIIVGCAPQAITATTKQPVASPTKKAAAATAETTPQQPHRPPHKERSFPERLPQLGITTPIAGEPSTKAQASESQLVASSCEKASTEEADARVKEMRAAVDASQKSWIAQQPQCWEEMRDEWRWQQEMKKQMESGQISGYGRGRGYGLGGIGDASGYAAGAGAVSRSAPTMGPAKATNASGTNNQVASVDEADIVKTDGRYVYFAANGALRIAEAMNPKIVSVTKIDGGGTVRELFVEGDRAVVYTSQNGAVKAPCTYGYDCQFGGDGTTTRISVYDITNRNEPKLAREMDLSGSLIAARRIGNAVHTVVADGDSPHPRYATFPPGMQMCGTSDKLGKEQFAKLKADNEKKIRLTNAKFPTLREKGNPKEQLLCNNLLRTAIRDGETFTTVVSFDLKNDKSQPTSASLESRPGAVFASSDALYLSVQHRKAASNGRWYSYYSPSVDEVSEIHKFRIGASSGDTKYIGSGTVPGHVLNQFSMDEWHGYLRIATTKGKVPDPKVESAVSILAESKDNRDAKTGITSLVRVGAVDHIAPGEDIRAVRFDDDRGYVVTFKKTDPLFVLDLFQPNKPQILGELKIPGFSTYMHRIDPDHLLSIGFDANDHGSFAYFDGVILQLFDVKNPTDPKLMHKEKIGSRGSSSEAATNHLAFNYFASQGLLAVPMTICEGGGDGRNGDQLTFSGLLVYDVDIERGFTKLGGVDHGTKGVSCGTWWSNANSAVKRSVFLDDLVYSIAGDRAKVQNMNRFGLDVADLSLTAQ